MNRMELESFWLLSFRFGFEFSTKLDQPGLSSSIRLEVMRVYPEMVYAIIVKLVILLFFCLEAQNVASLWSVVRKQKASFFFTPRPRGLKDSALQQHILKILPCNIFTSTYYPATIQLLFLPCSSPAPTIFALLPSCPAFFKLLLFKLSAPT